MSIDFARYLSIWLFDCHESEETFWRRMNPARLHALFDARLLIRRQVSEGFAVQAPAGPVNLRADGKWGSLSEYLGGG